MRVTISTCSIEGCQCGGPIKKGLCLKHYTRLRKYGDPLRERPTLSERINSKYDVQESTGCWIWNSALTNKGYGAIQLGVAKTGYAHRVSWELANGPIPDGLFVCHRCDTPACVNPSHLFLGNHLANMQDMALKKRSAVGGKNNTCKLSEADVLFVLDSKESNKLLGEKFGVHPMTIWRARTGRNWKDVAATRLAYRRLTFADSPGIKAECFYDELAF